MKYLKVVFIVFSFIKLSASGPLDPFNFSPFVPDHSLLPLKDSDGSFFFGEPLDTPKTLPPEEIFFNEIEKLVPRIRSFLSSSFTRTGEEECYRYIGDAIIRYQNPLSIERPIDDVEKLIGALKNIDLPTIIFLHKILEVDFFGKLITRLVSFYSIEVRDSDEGFSGFIYNLKKCEDSLHALSPRLSHLEFSTLEKLNKILNYSEKFSLEELKEFATISYTNYGFLKVAQTICQGTKFSNQDIPIPSWISWIGSIWKKCEFITDRTAHLKKYLFFPHSISGIESIYEKVSLIPNLLALFDKISAFLSELMKLHTKEKIAGVIIQVLQRISSFSENSLNVLMHNPDEALANFRESIIKIWEYVKVSSQSTEMVLEVFKAPQVLFSKEKTGLLIKFHTSICGLSSAGGEEVSFHDCTPELLLATYNELINKVAVSRLDYCLERAREFFLFRDALSDEDKTSTIKLWGGLKEILLRARTASASTEVAEQPSTMAALPASGEKRAATQPNRRKRRKVPQK